MPEELSLIILAGDDYGDPFCTIQSALAGDLTRYQIILVYDLPPSAPERVAALDRLRYSSLVNDGRITVVELGFRGGAAAQANAGLRVARHEIIALARAGTSIDPAFFKSALTALARETEFDFVMPQTIYSTSGHPARYLKARIAEGFNCSLQEQQLLCEFEFVARRSVALSIGFDESLDRFVDFDFHLRSIAAGHRYILSNRAEAQLDLSGAVHTSHYRRHLDAVLVKHAALFPGGTLNLVSLYDASVSDGRTSSPASTGHQEMVIGGREIGYYLNEPKPWWKVAIRHPTKIHTWLFLKRDPIQK